MRVVQYGMSLSASQRSGNDPARADGVFEASIKSLAAQDAPRRTSESFAPATTHSLLALQENVSEKLDRKRRVRQGFELLRGLDQLHREILSREVSGETLSGISAQLRQLQTRSDEPELARILAQIELRCAVELAKLSVGSAADDRSGADGARRSTP